MQRSPALACLKLAQLSPCGAEPEFKATFGLLRGLVFLHSAHMPWMANTLWQLLLSLDLFCCRHCWTALSLPSCCRQKRDASRLQACCSCGVPIWLWASEDEMPDSSTRMATTYRMTISRERPSLQNDLGGRKLEPFTTGEQCNGSMHRRSGWIETPSIIPLAATDQLYETLTGQ